MNAALTRDRLNPEVLAADQRELPDTLSLATLVATRLCHDMAGLCGTLGGALGMAAEDAGDSAEAIAIALESAQALSDRLKLLRIAWGSAEPLDRARVQALGAGLPGAHRLRLCLSGLDMQAILPPAFGQVALNALMLGAESLPMGGSLTLSGDEAAVEVRLDGPRAGWPSTLPALIADPASASHQALCAGSRMLQAPLLVLLAWKSGARLALLSEASGVARLVITAP